jgi:hypothetical protein
MVLRFGTHLDFLQFNFGNFLLGLRRPFACLILVLAEIHDPADRRFSVGGNFHQIKSALFRGTQGVVQSQDAQGRALVIDHPDLPSPDGTVDIRFLLSYGATSEW